MNGVAYASYGPCSIPIGCFPPFTSSAPPQSLSVLQGSRWVPPPPGSLSASISPSLHPYAFLYLHHLSLSLTPLGLLAFVLTVLFFKPGDRIFYILVMLYGPNNNDCQGVGEGEMSPHMLLCLDTCSPGGAPVLEGCRIFRRVGLGWWKWVPGE